MLSVTIASHRMFEISHLHLTQDNSKQINTHTTGAEDGENSSHHSEESDTMLPEMMFDEDRASSETHLPLFLGVSCYVMNASTKDEVDGATTNTLPTCLSE